MSVKIAERNRPIVDAIRALKLEHPFWGYRRVWAHLTYVQGLLINKKRVLRLMREHELIVKPNLRLKALRTPTRSKPRPTRPNEWWGIDMTKVFVEGFGWVYIVLVLDWHTKKIVGWFAGLQCKSAHWLEAVEMAVLRQFPGGARGAGVSMMADNGCQPTSEFFMRSCALLGIHQAFTSYNNPRGNADTERMMRTMKEELLWLREWRSPFELFSALGEWIEKYNTTYLHSTLGYMPPVRFETLRLAGHSTQLAIA